MNIIIKKVKLVAAPEPVFVGTRLTVVASDGQMTFKIVSAKKVADYPCIRVDWNDGIVDEIAGDISNLEHTYEKEGVYEIEIGDDITSLSIYSSTGSEAYLPMLVRLYSNSPSLTSLTANALRNAVNLVEFDLVETGITTLMVGTFAGCSSLRSVAWLPKGLTALGTNTFQNCTSLSTLPVLPVGLKALGIAHFRGCSGLQGRLDFPHVETLTYSSSGIGPFIECPGITEIHFSESHKESIQASIGWQKSQNLGAANATVFFDLL